MDISKLMEQAKKMQENMKSSTAELDKIIIEASSGGGMVNVKMNGNMKLISISIDEVTLTDKEMLEDLVTGAINSAISEAKKKSESELQKKAGDALGGLDLKGFKFPGM